MRHYERRLPHWDSIGQPLFVTFRHYDSLPANRVFPPDRLTSGRAFVAFDRLLDRATSGPLFLRIPDIADLVVEALRDGERRFGRYELHSFVVMPNQVHLLVTPRVVSTHWLGPLKGFTSHGANRILGRHGLSGKTRVMTMRSDAEFRRIQDYIEWNPVKAGLAGKKEDYRWSSAA